MPDRDRNKRRLNPIWYGVVLLVGIIIAVIALSSGRRLDMEATDHGEANAPELRPPWRVDLPDSWREDPIADEGARFVAEGVTVGGIEKLRGLREGEWDLTGLLPEDCEILSATQVAVAAGWGVVFDISIPVQSDHSALEREFEEESSQPYMAAPTRPETHCLIPLDGVTWDLWTRENIGFPPPSAREAAFSILQSLRWVGESDVQHRPLPGEVTMIAAKSDEAYPDGRLWGSFDVEITVCNNSHADAHDLKVLITKVISNPSYLELDTEIDTHFEKIDLLTPKASHILKLADLEVSHPEKDYEITADVVGGGRPLKLGVRMAFPPGSED